jgi:hypothetical protein
MNQIFKKTDPHKIARIIGNLVLRPLFFMLLWRWVVVPLTDFSTINFWMSLGILLLIDTCLWMKRD